jgi:16S rRNA (adenine1518-N6/adenine1519-N6)-dimethyltransferase
VPIIAKKSLGQNFLKSKPALKKIAEALDLKPEEEVVEVGPGEGQLTEELIKFQINLTAIEKDYRLAPELAKKYKERVKIIEGDILEELPKIAKKYKAKNLNYKLIGNIPYYLTGKLLRIIPDLAKPPEVCVFTIQKEVADRICAGPNELSLISAAIQGWGRPKKLFNLKKELFSPKPKVDSSTIRIDLNSELVGPNYYQLLQHLFRQPRKTLGNNLKSLWQEKNIEKERGLEILKSIGITENLRAQNLTPEIIKKLANIVYT